MTSIICILIWNVSKPKSNVTILLMPDQFWLNVRTNFYLEQTCVLIFKPHFMLCFVIYNTVVHVSHVLIQHYMYMKLMHILYLVKPGHLWATIVWPYWAGGWLFCTRLGIHQVGRCKQEILLHIDLIRQVSLCTMIYATFISMLFLL